MANSIVFQSSAEQLKTAVYGSDGTNFRPLKVNSSGELQVDVGRLGTINKVAEVGTVNDVSKVAVVGTLNKTSIVGTLNKVGVVGTLSKASIVGTVNDVSKVAVIGTLNKASIVGTLNKVGVVGTLSKASIVGTVNDVSKVAVIGTLNKASIVGTLNKVGVVGTLSKASIVGTVNDVSKVAVIGTLNKASIVGTLNKTGVVGTLNSIIGTVKVNLADKTFTNEFKTIVVNGNSSTYGTRINVSKYQDTTWYIRNITGAARRATVTIQLAVTPSINLTQFPRVLVQETATLKNNAKVITNDYFMKYIYMKVSNPSNTTQTINVAFNGRY